MHPQHKYARIERERRFLLDRFPSAEASTNSRIILDRYIEGSRLRLREQRDLNGAAVYKLAQKIPERADGAQRGFITNMYLTKDEFDVLAQLPAKTLKKVRYSIAPFGIDEFQGELRGLVLAEAEFDSADAAAELVLPSFIVREVSEDDRFTGGQLAQASRPDLRNWLAEYGIELRES